MCWVVVFYPIQTLIEGLEGRIEGLRAEVSSIKSDVMVLLKGWLEERVEGRGRLL